MSSSRTSSRSATGSDRPRVIPGPNVANPRRRRAGNLLVGAQFTLIGLCLLPLGPTIGPGLLRPLGPALLLAAVAVGILALVAMGRDMRVHPVPDQRAKLHTNGIYGVIRHPMYAAVLLACTGVMMSSGRVLSVLAVAALVVVLHVKARFEDQMLAELFGWSFAVYAQRVPALLPWPRPREPR
jgi:protein-S-isoprenylcysteine O-methyltransferase Ste14